MRLRRVPGAAVVPVVTSRDVLEAQLSEWMTVQQAAEALMCSPRTVWRAIADDQLPAYSGLRDGRRVTLVHADDVAALARPTRRA